MSELEPVRNSIVVDTDPESAFNLFTEGFDSWWPRSHHIGSSPMKRAVIEGRVGGRCYSEQEDGTDCPWGQILVWEPPRRFVMAWMITHEWGYQPDLAQSSEVDIRFIPTGDGATRVELEHRNFERHGAGGETMRTAVSAPGGWESLLEMYAKRAAETKAGAA